MYCSVIQRKSHGESVNFRTMLQVLCVSVVLTVLGFVAVVQAQIISPRYQQGYYNPSEQMPSNLLCDACADQSVPSGSWAVGLDLPFITTDNRLSFEVNIRPVTDIPPGGTSTAEDFVANFQMNLGFSNATGLNLSSCTRVFGDEFLRTRDGGGFDIPLYALVSEVALQASGAVTALSNSAAGSIPGRSSHFAQLPASSRDALLVATVTCPIDLTANVAGISLNGVGYTSNNKRLATADGGTLNQEVLTVTSSNLLNYPLDGTTQYLTRLDIHSDGAGVDLHFAESIPSSSSDINNLVFLLDGSPLTSSYTPEVIDTDTLRYRFDGGSTLSSSATLQVARNGDYYGISATTLNTIANTYLGGAPYIASTPAVNASNTQITVIFNTGIYDDPVGPESFNLVLTTTSSAVSAITISDVTATATTGQFVLTVDTTNPATGTERFDLELVFDGIGAATNPYSAAYPYQTEASNIALNDLAPPVITIVSDFSNVDNVLLTVTDDDPLTTVITYVRVTERTCDAAAYDSGTTPESVIEGTAISIGGPSDPGFSDPYCFRSVDVTGNTGYALNEPASPLITSVTVSGNTPYATSRDVSISVSDTEGIASVGFTQSTLSAVQACVSTDTTSIFEVQSGGPSMTNVIATHTFNQGTIDPIFVCAYVIDSDNNMTTATAAMPREVTQRR